MGKPRHLIPGTPEYVGYKKMRGREWTMRQLLRKQKGLCWVCKGPVSLDTPEGDDYATIEHILPLARGGTEDLGNLAASHRKCNQDRGAELPKPHTCCNEKHAEGCEQCASCEACTMGLPKHRRNRR